MSCYPARDTRPTRFGTRVMNDATKRADPDLEVIFTPEAIAGRLNELAREIAGQQPREPAGRGHPEGQLRVCGRPDQGAAQGRAGARGRFHDPVELQKGAHFVRAGFHSARHGSRRARAQRPDRRRRAGFGAHAGLRQGSARRPAARRRSAPACCSTSSCRAPSTWCRTTAHSIVPNEFVVGYGMDVAHRYRELPFVGRVVRQ